MDDDKFSAAQKRRNASNGKPPEKKPYVLRSSGSVREVDLDIFPYRRKSKSPKLPPQQKKIIPKPKPSKQKKPTKKPSPPSNEITNTQLWIAPQLALNHL